MHSTAVTYPILVIEDDAELRSALVELLRVVGFDSVQTAEDGVEGLNKIKELKAPHFVLIDLMMPKKNGLELLEEIDKSELKIKHHFALMSAFDSKEYDVDKYVFFDKPIDFPRLFQHISKIKRS